MEDIKDNGDTAGDAAPDAEEAGEFAGLLASGRNGGNRAGGLALLAIAVVIGGVLHYHFSNNGSNSFLSRLDSDLLTHAELTLATSEEGNRLAVVPSWPLRLYSSLRGDTILYAAAAALAAYLWGLSARAKARRDAWLVHRRLQGEIRELRRRLDMLDNSGRTPDITHKRESGRPGGENIPADRSGETKG